MGSVTELLKKNKAIDSAGKKAKKLLRQWKNKGGDKYCLLCGSRVVRFLPNGQDEEIFHNHHVIGGGYRESCICPVCGARDRQRWLYYVVEHYTDISSLKGKILHFAPEASVKAFIGRNKNAEYYGANIIPGIEDYTADITDIPFPDGTFDYVISNHLLEHVPDEAKAVSEVKRVLKASGRWIFSFPICTDMATYEDATITAPEDRLKAFGQEDHVRLYGVDYEERFRNYGLDLTVYRPRDILDEEEIGRFGLIADDVILIAAKQ